MTTTGDKNQNADDSFLKRIICKEEVKVHTEIVVKEKAVYLKKESPTIRYLKIQPYFRQKRPKSGKLTYLMPELKLCGKWLREAGFVAGSYVSVTVMDGLLVIREANAEETYE